MAKGNPGSYESSILRAACGRAREGGDKKLTNIFRQLPVIVEPGYISGDLEIQGPRFALEKEDLPSND